MLLPAGFGKKKKATIGVDIGSHATKIVRLNLRDKNKPIITYCGTLEIQDSDPELIPKLHAHLIQNKLTGLDAAACLDDTSLKIRKVALPKMPDSDLREAIRWKMRDVVEGSVDDYVVRSSHLNPDESDTKQMTLVGYAIRKASVTHLTQILQKAGLKAGFIEPGAVSLAACVEKIFPAEEDWLAALDLGRKKSVMIIMGKGKFYFSRPLSGITVPSDMSAQEGFNQKLAAEVQNTLDTFAVTYHVEHINRIFLSGGGAGIPGLANYLTTNLGLHTEILNPFSGIDIPLPFEQTIKERPYLYCQAFALASLQV